MSFFDDVATNPDIYANDHIFKMFYDDVPKLEEEEEKEEEGPSSSSFPQEKHDKERDEILEELLDEGDQPKEQDPTNPQITSVLSEMINSDLGPLSPVKDPPTPATAGPSNFQDDLTPVPMISENVRNYTVFPLPDEQVRNMNSKERAIYKKNLEDFKVIYLKETKRKKKMPALFNASEKLLLEMMKAKLAPGAMKLIKKRDDYQELKKILTNVKEELNYPEGFTKQGIKRMANLANAIEDRVVELESRVNYLTRSPGAPSPSATTAAAAVAGQQDDMQQQSVMDHSASGSASVPGNTHVQSTRNGGGNGDDNGGDDGDDSGSDHSEGPGDGFGNRRHKHTNQDSVSKAIKTRLADGDYQTIAETTTVTTVRKGKRPKVNRSHQSTTIPLTASSQNGNNGDDGGDNGGGSGPSNTKKRKTYDDIQKENSDVIWIQGLPDDPFKHFKPFTRPGLLILDDAMVEVKDKANKVNNWFTKGSHHKNISIAILLQNIFPEKLRTISVNAHISVIFRSPRDKLQTRSYVRQVYPYQEERVQQALAYAHQVPFRPLILNLHQDVLDEYGMMVDLFPEDLKESKNPFPQVLLPPNYSEHN
ncbi:hypothetical protein AC249_AIPGENE8675 [Exaiptasia diaphana]|nr:hypothetical protein AC249_AIPGENE8675 [Exaiptasia diaphana]